MSNRDWSIDVVAQDLDLGPWDYWDQLFSDNGHETAHSFLILKDDTGKTISRIDGLAYDSVSGQDKFSAGGLTTYLSIAARSLGLSDQFERVTKFLGVEHEFPRLKAYIQMGDDSTENFEHESVTLIKKPQDQIMQHWLKACEAAQRISKDNASYVATDIFRSGQNCHSVTATLLKAAGRGLSKNPFQNFSVPGLQNSLLDEEELAEIQDYHAPPENHMSLLKEYCRVSGQEFPLRSSKTKAVRYSTEARRRLVNANVFTPQECAI